ncbi:hypothetical protein F383_38584 [Gossypium arboreum]|uniref:Uncharacterized protein n=1 Tax=Gossypium arboreum TaxID=29729 RepID=A0A0B0MK60_GOSAR|nr:hypothetical protein F383_38584 [Gossypium arboreum]
MDQSAFREQFLVSSCASPCLSASSGV